MLSLLCLGARTQSPFRDKQLHPVSRSLFHSPRSAMNWHNIDTRIEQIHKFFEAVRQSLNHLLILGLVDDTLDQRDSDQEHSPSPFRPSQLRSPSSIAHDPGTPVQLVPCTTSNCVHSWHTATWQRADLSVL